MKNRVVLGVVLTLLFSTMALVGQQHICERIDKKTPKGLVATQGTQKDEYWFDSMTDYDAPKDGPNTIVNIIRNKKAKVVLPVEWLDASMPFKRFVGCRVRTRDTFFDVEEKPKSKIEYGPAKQHPAEVSVYAPKANAQGKIPKDAKTYSRIVEDHEDAKIDLRFASFITNPEKGRTTFIYYAWHCNSKESPLYFVVPGLSDYWEKDVPKMYKFEILHKWNNIETDKVASALFSKDTTFPPKSLPEPISKFVVQIDGPITVIEKAVTLSILKSRDATDKLDSGDVTALVPMLSK